ncbi:hypothetical protein [Streptomyces oceani]|uniref:hypothetical protein n=1 Tax=Streptomyces oceani TaxID=1075402 RepID=UPI00147E11B2|nr:hypothetical protein [Streptomyces oceani]
MNESKAEASGFCDMLVSREENGEFRPSFNVTVSVRQLHHGYDDGAVRGRRR